MMDKEKSSDLSSLPTIRQAVDAFFSELDLGEGAECLHAANCHRL
jgi:hypothetical protein